LDLSQQQGSCRQCQFSDLGHSSHAVGNCCCGLRVYRFANLSEWVRGRALRLGFGVGLSAYLSPQRAASTGTVARQLLKQSFVIFVLHAAIIAQC